jgi:hypothetical protein
MDFETSLLEWVQGKGRLSKGLVAEVVNVTIALVKLRLARGDKGGQR